MFVCVYVCVDYQTVSCSIFLTSLSMYSRNACIHRHIHSQTHTCLHTCNTCIHAYMHTYTWCEEQLAWNLYQREGMYAYYCVCMYVCMYVCVCIYIYIIYIYTNIYMRYNIRKQFFEWNAQSIWTKTQQVSRHIHLIRTEAPACMNAL